MRARIGRLSALVLAGLLTLCLLVGGCGRPSAEGEVTSGDMAVKPAANPLEDPTVDDCSAYLGGENYLGPLVILHWETDGDGMSGIRHREVKDLEGILSHCRRPVLLSFYDELADHAHSLLPGLEQLAADYREEVHVILAQPSAQSDILAYFDKDLLPVTYLVQEAEIVSFYPGWSDEVAADIAKDLDGLINAAD